MVRTVRLGVSMLTHKGWCLHIPDDAYTCRMMSYNPRYESRASGTLVLEPRLIDEFDMGPLKCETCLDHKTGGCGKGMTTVVQKEGVDSLYTSGWGLGRSEKCCALFVLYLLWKPRGPKNLPSGLFTKCKIWEPSLGTFHECSEAPIPLTVEWSVVSMTWSHLTLSEFSKFYNMFQLPTRNEDLGAHGLLTGSTWNIPCTKLFSCLICRSLSIHVLLRSFVKTWWVL